MTSAPSRIRTSVPRLLWVVIAAALFWGADARAENRRWAVLLGTHFPIDLAAAGELRLPHHFFLNASVGWMPRGYGNVVLSTLEGVNLVNSTERRVLNAAINNLGTLGAQLGWMSSEDHGFVIMGGYRLLGLGGGLTPLEALAALANVPFNQEQSLIEFNANIWAHQATLSLGWRWRLAESWFLQASLEGFATFDANSNLDLSVQGETPPDAIPVLNSAERALDRLLVSNFHFGTVNVFLGFEF